MAREITKTLFNKNHILLTRTENCNEPASRPNLHLSTDYKLIQSDNRKGWGREASVTKKSPLGFYYKSRQHPERVSNRENNWAQIKHLEFVDGSTKYTLLYPYKYAETSIGAENRPWHLYPDYEVFHDHYIRSLQTEVEKLFQIIKDSKISDYEEEKFKVFVDLFGHKDGYKQQTDAEKIVSHGFDLKTSFRNM